MMFNLYLVRKLSIINNARAIFLMELHEKIYIDIGAHLYSIITEATKTTARSKLVVPNLIMRILHDNGVETPQNISLMTSSPSINTQTILRSRIQIPRDEQAEKPKEIQRLKQKDNNLLQDVVVVKGGAEHHCLHQLLLMLFRSYLRGLIAFGMQQLSTPTALQLSRTKSTCWQPRLIALLTSLNPLAIPVKKGKQCQVAFEGELILRGRTQHWFSQHLWFLQFLWFSQNLNLVL